MHKSARSPHGSGEPSLREAGLKQTPQRKALLDVLQVADRPLTVEEILGRMTGKRPGVPTLYRNLECFAGQGWVESLVGPDQVQRFVRCHSAHHHHHIVCDGCGRVAETDCLGLEALLEQLGKSAGYKVTRHQLTLYGLCPQCQCGSD
nr:Fur family transcriptional regulator [uncultured Holophaga sp.]